LSLYHHVIEQQLRAGEEGSRFHAESLRFKRPVLNFDPHCLLGNKG
jgi:hypothetical protein